MAQLIVPESAEKRALLESLVAENGGILRMEPAWVCRDFLPAGYRLGLEKYTIDDHPERGEISERWIISTTKADNTHTTPTEGLSHIVTGTHQQLLLRDALAIGGDILMGEEYARDYKAMLEMGSGGILAKIYDFQVRIMNHIHQMIDCAAKKGRFPKPEAYHFMDGVPMGVDNTTFFSFLPEVVSRTSPYELKCDYLQRWVDGKLKDYSETLAFLRNQIEVTLC